MYLSKHKNTDRIFEIECLRGFAAIYVLLFHVIRPEIQQYSYVLSIPFRFGQEAVILFFLLSGFCINYSWSAKAEKRFGIFAESRFVRIVPIYVVALIVSYLCASLSAGTFINFDISTLAGNVLFLQDRARAGTIVTPYMGNEPLWSLSYEVAFYMFYYFLVRYVPLQKRTLTVSGISIVFFLLMLIYPNQLSRFVAYFCIWWVGAIMSEIYLGRLRTSQIFVALIPVLFIAGCLAFLAFDAPDKIDIGNSNLFPYLELRHFGSAAIISLLLIGWAAMGWKYFRQLFGPFIVFAPVSYAIYVLHFPLMVEARNNLIMPSWLSISLTASATIMLAFILEGPFQKSISRKMRKQKPLLTRLLDGAG